MDVKKAAEITAMIGRMIEKPAGQVAKETDIPIASRELIDLMWRLIFGDMPDDDGPPGTILILASFEGFPLIGWQARKLPAEEIVGLIATSVQLLNDTAQEKGMKIDIRQKVIDMINEMTERDGLKAISDGQTPN